jgi:hypothetical protein
MDTQSLDIREIEMSGRQYTWAGSGDDPTFEKLDRVLVSAEWEQKFPLTIVHAKDRSNSDHTPLLLNTGASSHNKQPPPFKFEQGWLIRDGFRELVANKWQSEVEEPLLWKNGRIELGPFGNSLEDGLKLQLVKTKRKKDISFNN